METIDPSFHIYDFNNNVYDRLDIQNNGKFIFIVPNDSPDILKYGNINKCFGTINIVNSASKIYDNEISNNLKKASDFMQSDNGAEKAAALIVDLK